MDLIINGCYGQMGQILTQIALKKNNISCGINPNDNHIDNSKNFKSKFLVLDDIYKFNGKADVVIDFSVADAVDRLIRYCIEKKIPAVICTTGLTQETEKKILDASKFIPIIKSANMSLGINILELLLKKTAKIFFENDFDIEIIEKHHNKKIDAPSGTALNLAETIKKSIDPKDNKNICLSSDRDNRNNKKQKITKNEIGISCVRGGTIVGEHSIIFAGNNETIEIKHTAQSREIFALGALKAAEFILDKSPGLYSMHDLIKDFII